MKFNAALTDLPGVDRGAGRALAGAGHDRPHDGLEAAQDACDACERGEPAVGFGEIYIQTGYDPTPAPEGHHLLASSASTRPTSSPRGRGRHAATRSRAQFIDLIDRFAPGFEARLVAHEVLGPPDIEERIGLTGGNIFQGEVTPDQMWEHRLSRAHARSPGSTSAARATHPPGA